MPGQAIADNVPDHFSKAMVAHSLIAIAIVFGMYVHPNPCGRIGGGSPGGTAAFGRRTEVLQAGIPIE